MTNANQAIVGRQLSLFRGIQEEPIPTAEEIAVSLDRGECGGLSGTGCLWTDRELAAWAPPEKLLVSEWAERHRMLPARQTARPGPWSNVAAHTVEVMDAFIDPYVEQITIMASVQSSKTESAYNMLGYAICQDPGPALVVMPTIGLVRRVNNKIKTMIEDSPATAVHLTGDRDDLTRQELRLDNMSINFATAGSSADLRNIEVRYLLLDETDDYEGGIADQGSPIEMATARTTTFWNRKIVCVCTPTTDDGYIAVEYDKSNRCKCWVPCPYCHGYQLLSFWRVKHRGAKLGEWPKDKRDPDYIKINRVARYECEHCGAEIDDRDKKWMLRFRTWLPEGHPIEKDGTVAIPLPKAMHVGFNWSALYSPFRTFSETAAEFFKTKDDPEKYKTFVNLWLAEPWKEVARKRETAEILALRTEYPQLEVPAGTVALTAGIDNQANGKWVVIRAWQRDLSSHLVRHGFVETWEELEQWIFRDVYPLEGSDMVLPIWRAAIDTGGTGFDEEDETMTEQVYDWLRGAGRGVFGVKGLSKSIGGGKKMKLSVIDKMPGKSGRPIPGGIRLWLLDTALIKNAISMRIEAGKFHLHSGVGEIYARHLTAEAKQRDKRGKFAWTVQGKRANHLFDCEVYAAAMADPECDGGVMVLNSPNEPAVKRGRKVLSKGISV